MNQTLYVLNNFNDISWWKIEFNVELATNTITWGRRTHHQPPQETQHGSQVLENSTIEEYYSRIAYQRDRKGYSVEIPTSRPSLPMLAQEYKKNPEFAFTALQPKLDGIRCIMSNEGLLSRKNRYFTSCPHLELYIHKLPDGIKLDGELIIPNTPINTIESLVMRGTPDLRLCQEIEYHVFDIVDTEAPFYPRIQEAARIVEEMENFYIKCRTEPNHPYQKLNYFSKKCPFKMVYTVLHGEPISDDELKDQFDEFKAQGYEGMMVRNADGPYEINKRSPNLLKMKSFVDSEFEIVDVVEGAGKTGVFVCKASNGSEFKCSFRGTNSKRQQILKYKDNYIGKFLQVEFEGLSEYGIPRCPVGVRYFAKEETDKPLPSEPIDTGNLD
jgi:DNA ligase-1